MKNAKKRLEFPVPKNQRVKGVVAIRSEVIAQGILWFLCIVHGSP